MAAFNRYFFNTKSQQCEPFTYGGCGGNENNFESFEQCQKECCVKNTNRNAEINNNEVCKQPKLVGPCRAAFESYYFNTEKDKCEKFYYGISILS